MIDSELNLNRLRSSEILYLFVSRLLGNISKRFAMICNSLVVANPSTNNFSGEIGSSINGFPKLEYVDMSSNSLTENLPFGFRRFKEFAVCENLLNDQLHSWVFSESYSLEALHLSENALIGKIPTTISNCKNLAIFNEWGNYLFGNIQGELESSS
ncbi:hypothetical protein L1887_16091 [Cichorium endivia]|nr:hypothetical protein L1887_16091 [Cichorium endivia]